MSTWLSIATKQTWNRDGGSFTRSPSIICLHSTEGGSWPGYSAGADAPHFTIDPRTGDVRQHTPINVAGRALMHPAGTPETNRAGVIQVEIIGTCDGATASRYNLHYLPDMTDAEAANINRLLVAIFDATGIPLETTVTWKQYPASYGPGNGVRLSRSAFANYRGVLGHQHVCDNDHGDPGNLPIAKILGAHRDTPQPSRGITRPPVKAVKGADRARVAKMQGLLEVTADGVWGDTTDQWALRLRTAARAHCGYPKNTPAPFRVDLVQKVIDVTPDNQWGPQSQAALVKWVKGCQVVLGETDDGSWGPGTDAAFTALRNANHNRF